MTQYRLRTLLIVLAIGPPMLAAAWFGVERYRDWQDTLLWTDVGGPGTIVLFESHTACRFDTDLGDEPAEESLP